MIILIRYIPHKILENNTLIVIWSLLIQDGSYPGTGKFDEIGQGDGKGTTLNLPLPGGSGDFAMRTVFDEVIVPCAQRFKPDIILVSAGWVYIS